MPATSAERARPPLLAPTRAQRAPRWGESRGEGSPPPSKSSPPPSKDLALELHQVAEDLVRAGDDPGVGLEAALGDDQVGELLGQVDVRHLERAGGELTPTGAARNAELGQAGVVRRPEHRVAD